MRAIDVNTKKARDVVCSDDGRLLCVIEGLEEQSGLPEPTLSNSILLSDGDGWTEQYLFGSIPPPAPVVDQPWFRDGKSWCWDGTHWVSTAPYILNGLDGNAIVNIPFVHWKVVRLLTEGDYFSVPDPGSFYRWVVQSYKNFSDLPTIATLDVLFATTGYNYISQEVSTAVVSKTAYQAVRIDRATVGSPPGANIRITLDVREVLA